jgi:hypothetical protein
MYRIVRFYRNKPGKNRVIKEGLTLEQAQAHCQDPKTAGKGWFDGYREMNPKPKSGYRYRSISDAVRLLLAKDEICHRVAWPSPLY